MVEPGVEAGPFVAVAVNDTLTLDFDDRGAFEPHHYGFRVDGGTLEAAPDGAGLFVVRARLPREVAA